MTYQKRLFHTVFSSGISTVWDVGLILKLHLTQFLMASTTLYLMTQVRFTYADLQHFPDDGKRREIIHGDLYVAPAPSPAHQDAVLELAYRLRRFLEDHPLGKVYIAPLDVIFSEEDVVEPDLMFVTNARRALISPRGIEGPPDWVVEVLSPSTKNRDLTIKKKLCQREGVRAYWVVDVQARTITTWDADWDAPTTLTSSETARVSVLPGFQLEVQTLFS